MYIIPESGPNEYHRSSSSTHEYRAMRPYTKASIGSRFLAWVIDGFIELLFIVPLIIWIVKVIIIADSAGASSGDEDARIAFSVLMIIFLYIVMSIASIAYFLLKDGFRGGQSIGKKIMGIKVIKLYDGADCDYRTALVRNALYILVSMIPLVGQLLGPIMVCVREDGRRIGDLVADTMVVNA